MSKKTIAILLLAAILLFAGADYALNISKASRQITVETPDEFPNLVERLLQANPETLDYEIIRRSRTNQLFEKVDLTALTNVRIYRSQLEKPGRLPLIIYEVQGPENQGGVTYLHVKLATLDQIDATESLNETNEFGHSSFYFNDLNHPDLAFLLTQIGDHLYGFQFKKTNPEDFETVRGMIRTLLNPFNS